jgi:3-oxoacyl-[acyl-carrier protein] reductase
VTRTFPTTARICLVTGASSGLGRAMAVALAEAGHTQVAVAWSGNAEGGAQTCKAVEAAGATSLGVAVDISDPDSVDRAFAQVEAAFGPPEVLVNNAGINRDGLVMRMSDDDWQVVLDTNLTGAFHCTRRVLGAMMRQRFGRVVNVSSVVGGRIGNPGQANYAASKAGLIGLTRTVAAEVARKNVTVNAVAPGFIETDMTADVPDAVKESVPARRAGTPDEVAACVRFLASDAAGYVTGTTLYVDGGLAA